MKNGLIGAFQRMAIFANKEDSFLRSTEPATTLHRCRFCTESSGLWNERPAIGLVHHPVAHQPHVVEVARNILYNFDIVVRAIRFFVVERFDRYAVLMLEKRIEQRAVGVIARVFHDIDLERRRIDKRNTEYIGRLSQINVTV